ncbi:hypothetical protein B0T20DRAFT_356024 [Sordaria brevicollis]|uniref:Bulb-type lectin domain-containing protein n=1 Tax=Sordaria brevicollis TaxID=83679 RepID=A0AAE0PBZ1_SORBR|nr:hypothetical protein B0T20DRAFT_356024 [Sordaria brevicollis]
MVSFSKFGEFKDIQLTAQKEPEKPTSAEVGSKDRLNAGEELTNGQRISSPNGEYTLVMQEDCNLVLCRKGESPIWERGKTPGVAAERLVFRKDGELELLTWSGDQKWATGTAGRGNSNSFFAIRDDGNLVIETDGQIAWSSKTGPEIPVAKRDRIKGGERLIAGEALTSPNGRFTLTLQNDGNFVLYEGKQARWASGRFSSRRGGGWLVLSAEGNITTFSDDQSSLWSTRTRYRRGGGDCELIIQDDGAAVVKLDGITIWAVNGGSAQTYEPRDFTPVTSGDKIGLGQYLAAGQSIASRNGDMCATVEKGRIIVRHTKTGDFIIISANPRNETATKLTVGYNDDIILWGENGSKIWQSSDNINEYAAINSDEDDRQRDVRHGNDREGGLVVDDTGDLRLYAPGWSNGVVWRSGRYFPGFSGKRLSELKPGEILVIGQTLLSKYAQHELSLLPSGNLCLRSVRLNSSTYYFTNYDTRLTDAHYLEFGHDYVLEVRGETNGMIWRSSNRKLDLWKYDDYDRSNKPPRFIVDDHETPYIRAVDHPHRARYKAWLLTDLESSLTPTKPASVGDTLRPKFTLKPEHILQSTSGNYQAKFTKKGEFVLVSGTDEVIIWRAKRTVYSDSVWITEGGNLCVGEIEEGNIKWQSETAGTGSDARLVVQDDGNMCLYAGGKCTWHSDTVGGWRKDLDVW